MFEITENIIFSRVEDAALLLITKKMISAGVWSHRRKPSRVLRAESLGMEACITPVKSWSGKDEEKNGKRLNHKKQASGQLKRKAWQLVLKAAGRPGKKGMDC